MIGHLDLAHFGALLSDPTRASFLLMLLGGGEMSSSALAQGAGVSRSLASTHLRKLEEGRLVVAEPRGRQRLYRLAGQGVADGLEALLRIAPEQRVTSLRAARALERLRRGRMCYDHLAGSLGVELRDTVVESGLVAGARDPVLTTEGLRFFAALDIDVARLERKRRPLIRDCADWSEGRDHLGGSLGAALSTELLRRGWVETEEATRVVCVTEVGREALWSRFGLDLEPTEAPDAAAVRPCPDALAGVAS